MPCFLARKPARLQTLVVAVGRLPHPSRVRLSGAIHDADYRDTVFLLLPPLEFSCGHRSQNCVGPGARPEKELTKTLQEVNLAAFALPLFPHLSSGGKAGRASGRTVSEESSQDSHLDRQLARCQERIEYHFREPGLLREALTHASGANHRLSSNERLEFLGDAILGAIVCELLYHQYPQYLEGDLTKVKSVVVSRQTCAKVSEGLGMQEFLILGKGLTTHPGVPSSLLADVFESLVAAIYLDGGYEEARRFVARHLAPEIVSTVDGELGGNYKSLLQQIAQRQYGTTPTYELLDEKGPDHSKCFKIAAQVGASRYEPAWGRNKKEAEQRAAGNALSQLDGRSPPYPSS